MEGSSGSRRTAAVERDDGVGHPHTGLLLHVFDHYGPRSEGAIAKRQNGVMISNGQGPSPAYSLVSLQERGRLLVSEGDNIYEG